MTELIKGDVYSDARGRLRFCNAFDMSSARRFYTISNSPEQPVRGWIGHKRETKWFFPLKGTTTITVEPMSKSTCSNCSLAAIASAKEATRFNLSASSPSVLKIPGGNWFCIEQHDGAEVMVFSDCKVGEYENDDFRRSL
jgi:dTDP-4-dehydrorhamnose 3,5-epimerase